MDESKLDRNTDVSTDTLIDYHFGTLAPEAAAVVEQRLLEDAAALRRYLELKRALDRPAAEPERPSAAVRERLRAAVAADYGPGWRRGLRQLLRRPVPLYQTMALAAAVVLVVAAFSLRHPPSAGLSRENAVPSLTAPVATGTGEMVDSARTVPFSLQIF